MKIAKPIINIVIIYVALIENKTKNRIIVVIRIYWVFGKQRSEPNKFVANQELLQILMKCTEVPN